MRKNWKRWAAILGGALLLCSPFEAVPAKAAENQQQVAPQETLQAATDLHWSERGQAVFTNPNSVACEATVKLTYPDGRVSDSIIRPMSSLRAGETCTLDYFHIMSTPGDYSFQVTLTANGVSSGEALSDTFTYAVPDKKLPAPIVNSVTRDGIITLSLPETDGEAYEIGTDYGFGYQLLRNGAGSGQGARDENILDFRSQVGRQDGVYSIKVRTVSRNINKYQDSDWSEPIPINPPEQQSGSEDSDWSEPIPINPPEQQSSSEDSREFKVWVPTPEEMKLYDACGTDEVIYTESADNAYNVTIMNSIQGFLCWNSFDTVREDYTIGRTYNIYPTYLGKVYNMESKAKITLTIPEALRAENRSFRMIVVTEDGKAAVLKDLDSNPNTITFETDTYYAFALAYRDKAASKK